MVCHFVSDSFKNGAQRLGIFPSAPWIQSHFLVFLGIVCLGSISLSLVFTLLAAIAAKAQQNAALMAILGFPLIVPQLLLVIRLSKAAFGEQFRTGAILNLTGLIVGLDIMVLVLSIILFPFLWKD